MLKNTNKEHQDLEIIQLVKCLLFKFGELRSILRTYVKIIPCMGGAHLQSQFWGDSLANQPS